MSGPYAEDKPLTAILGEKCPKCLWRGGRHRPAIALIGQEAGPEWVEGGEDGE